MKIQLQIIANNILQQIPSIALRIDSQKYLFNLPQQHQKYFRRHYYNYGASMAIFFTKYNSDTLGSLMPLTLCLSQYNKGYGTRFYLNNNGYIFMKYLKKYLGFRMLPYSSFNFQSDIKKREIIYGIKNNQQFQKLLQIYRSKFYYSNIDNQVLIRNIKEINNAYENIVQDQGKDQQKQNQQNIQNDLHYRDDKIQIISFKIGNKNTSNQQLPYYNFICLPRKIPFSINQQKVQNFKKQNRQHTSSFKQLFIAGFVTLATGAQVNLSDFKQQNQPNPNFLILHYKTKQNIQQILNHHKISQYLHKNNQLSQQMYTDSIIHIIQGTSQIILSQQFRELRKKFGKNVKHLIYNKQCKNYINSQQFLKQLLSMYPYFILTDITHQYYPSFMPNITKQIIQYYNNGNFNKYFNIITSSQQGGTTSTQNIQQGYLMLNKNRYQLILSPSKNRGYVQINDTRAQTADHSKIFKSDNICKAYQSQIKLYNYQQKFNNVIKNKLKQITKEYDPQIIFLGTSSRASTFYRNVSGILVKLPGEKFSILMDCGDGIYDQIINHFGPQKYVQEIKKIKIMFLTHFHSDHCSGIFHFIAKRNKILRQSKDSIKQKLFLIMPKNMVGWYEVYNKNVENLDQFCDIVFSSSLSLSQLPPPRIVYKRKQQRVALFSNSKKQQTNQQKVQKTPNQSVPPLEDSENSSKQNTVTMSQCMSDQTFYQNQYPQQSQYDKDAVETYQKNQNKIVQQFKSFLSSENIIQFQPVPVYHCNQSFGIIIQHKSLVKISYSGDCRPTPLFKSKSKDSTLLIHQATFTDNYVELAKKKKHSTPKQAAQIGYQSGSIITSLTHFSTRASTDRKYKNKQDLNMLRNMNKDQLVENPIKKKPYYTFQEYRIKNVFQACDHLQFKLSQMYRLTNMSKKFHQFMY